MYSCRKLNILYENTYSNFTYANKIDELDEET